MPSDPIAVECEVEPVDRRASVIIGRRNGAAVVLILPAPLQYGGNGANAVRVRDGPRDVEVGTGRDLPARERHGGHGRRVLVRGPLGHLIDEGAGGEGRRVESLLLGIRRVVDIGNPSKAIGHAEADDPVPAGPVARGGGDIEARGRVAGRPEGEAGAVALVPVIAIDDDLDYRRD